jgi:hypothetical protein
LVISPVRVAEIISALKAHYLQVNENEKLPDFLRGRP